MRNQILAAGEAGPTMIVKTPTHAPSTHLTYYRL